jgi:hypothetical protein
MNATALRRQHTAAPRFLLQQNFAKAAKKAEQSDSRFLTKEELEQVEDIIGCVS